MKEILDHSQLSRLCRWYEDALKLIPEAKTRALRAAADAVKQELDRQISSRLDDSHGKGIVNAALVWGAVLDHRKPCCIIVDFKVTQHTCDKTLHLVPLTVID